MGALHRLVVRPVSRAVRSVRALAMSFVHKHGDRFYQGSRWISVDGIAANGPFVTSDFQWTVVFHSYWWAARPATDHEKLSLRAIPEEVEKKWIAPMIGAIDFQNIRPLHPSVVPMSMDRARAWAEAGEMPRCGDCRGYCEAVAGPDTDAERLAVYSSVARFGSWKTRYQRDVFSAMLRTAPPYPDHCWGIRTHIDNPGGGAYMTLVTTDHESKDPIWVGQIRSVTSPSCENMHDPKTDACHKCDRTDAEYWREQGDGLA